MGIAAPRRPPAPRGRLVSGHLREFVADPLGFLTRCARVYGDVVRLRFAHVPVYLLNHPDYIEYVLGMNEGKFIKGRARRGSRMVFGNGLLASEGDRWRRQRRLAQPAFHRARIAAYGEAMVACAERLLADWQDGETRDVQRDMMALTLEIVGKTLFGADVSCDVEKIGTALNVLTEQFMTVTMPSLLIPEGFPTPGNLLLKRTIRRLDDIIYRMIALRRLSSREYGDLLSLLLDAEDKDGSPLTDLQLRDG